MKRILPAVVLVFLGILSGAAELKSPFEDIALDTVEWQFCASLTEIPSRDHGEPVRAFLWVPPRAARVRGVVIGQFNMVERPILENPFFRKHLEAIDWGCVWLDTGMFGGHFEHRKPENSRKMQAVFDRLAEVTGLDYLRSIPFIGIGHSAYADFGYEIAAWSPERAVGAVSYDGNTLCVSKQNTLYDHPFVTPDDLEKMKGIPLLHRDSEGNSGTHNNERTPVFRERYPDVPFTILADPSSTHFGFPDESCDFLGSWIVEADKLRNPNGGLPLVKVDPRKGWYVDFWRYDASPLVPAAPVGEYTRNDGNWVFSKDQACRMLEHVTRHNSKKHCIGAFEQNGRLVPDNGGHVGFSLAFDPGQDGLTFPLKAVFRQEAVKGRQTGWARMAAGDRLEVPGDDDRIRIRRIVGPVEVLDKDYAAVRFDRYGFVRSGRSSYIGVILEYPGNEIFRRTEIPAEMKIPLFNREGDSQSIAFPALVDIPAGTKEVKLNAVSSLGLPVEYFVDYGPVYLKNGTLYMTELPECVSGPLEVKVTAWQYGRSIEPKVASAQPVSRTFRIMR